MADLSYEDVRRAANEALRSLEDALGEVRGIVKDINGRTGALGDIHARTSDLQATFQRIESQLQLTHDMVAGLSVIAQNQTHIDARLSAIEDTTSTIHARLDEVHDHLGFLRQTFSQQQSEQGT